MGEDKYGDVLFLACHAVVFRVGKDYSLANHLLRQRILRRIDGNDIGDN